MKPTRDLKQEALFGQNGTISSQNITAPDGSTSTFTISNTEEDNSKQMTIMTANNDSNSSGSADLLLGSGNAGAGPSGDVKVRAGTSSGPRGKVSLEGSSVDLNSAKLINVGTPTLDSDAATKEYVDTEVTSAVTTAAPFYVAISPREWFASVGILIESHVEFPIDSNGAIIFGFLVPDNYVPGTQLKLRLVFLSTDNTTPNTFSFITTYYKFGIAVSPENTSIPVILDGSEVLTLDLIEINLTDVNGEVNSIEVGVNDHFQIGLQATEDNPGVVAIFGTAITS